jgi:outer membrane protein
LRGRSWVAAAALFCASPLLAATETADLTLADALARALHDNPRILGARAEVEANRALKKAAFSLVLPKIGVTGNVIRNSSQVSFGSDDDQRLVLPGTDWSYRITLQQPIFAGFREKRVYEQQKLAITAAEETVRAGEDAALLRVAADYLGAVQATALLDVERRNQQLAEQRRKQASDLFEAGETTRVEVLRADTAIKAAQRRTVAAEQDRAAAVGRLRVDLAVDTDLVVHDPGPLPLPALPDEAALVSQAEGTRPEVRAAELSVRTARLEVKKQQGAYLPVVTADAAYVSQKSTFPKDKYGFAALRFSVPLFQGGEVGARVAAARARLRAAELALEDAKRGAREDVRTAMLALVAARTGLALAEEQLAAAEAEYAQMFEMYKSQEATALDAESSESSLAEARRAVASGRLEAQLAELRVWSAAGTLPDLIKKEVLR